MTEIHSNKIKLIIAGGRDFHDIGFMRKTLEHLFSNTGKPDEVVCGMAKGADLLGFQWASENSIPVAKFHADWNKHGKAAGYIRNEQMANYATHCVCFWDGKSKGTEHMIDLAKKKNLKLKIIGYRYD